MSLRFQLRDLYLLQDDDVAVLCDDPEHRDEHVEPLLLHEHLHVLLRIVEHPAVDLLLLPLLLLDAVCIPLQR